MVKGIVHCFSVCIFITLYSLTFRFRNADETDADNKSRSDSLKQQRVEKVNKLLEKNRRIMNLVIQLLGCSKLNDIPNLALDVNRHLDNVERGSIFMNTKCKSLLGRWYTKEKKEEKEPKDSNDLLIERDRIISCYAKEITFHEGKKVKTMKRKLFRILSKLRSLFWQRHYQYLIHTIAIHIHYFKAEIFPLKIVSSSGNST